MAAPLTWEDLKNQSSLPIKMEIAYDILQPNKLSFDIAQIDRCINLTDRGGGGLCITSSGSSLRHTNNILLTRLCVRALLSKRQGGFGSPSVIFVDAGNCSDIYQCVNFARQYGLDVQKVLDSIMVSRPFTIHQLAGLVSNHLDSAGAAIVHHFGAKLVVISDPLRMFAQDPQIDPDEALWLVKVIARALRNLSRQVVVAVSMSETCPTPQYQSLLMSLFDNRIHISSTKREPNNLKITIKVRSNQQQNRESLASSFVMAERDLRIIPSR
jgi:Rad51